MLHTWYQWDPSDDICRSNDARDCTPQTDILKECVLQVRLRGDSFTADVSKVYTNVANITTKHPTAESKTQARLSVKKCTSGFIALHDHFLGVGVHSCDILYARNTLNTLIYSGEGKTYTHDEASSREN